MSGLKLVRHQAEQDKLIEARVKKAGDTMTGNLTMSGAAKVVGNLQGNSDTATRLQNARNISINGVARSFNGTGNIGWTLGEIGASPSNHTHNYAGSNTAGGAANSAVKLQTPRNINGVAFDGTKNITVVDNTKLPLTGGTVTGRITCQNLDATSKITCTNLDVSTDLVFSRQVKSVFDGNPNRLSLRGVTNENQARIKLGNGAEISSGAGESRFMVDGGLYTNGNLEGVQIQTNGPIFPNISAHGGWDCGLINNRFYTVYCVNVNQSSDRNLKKDIHYLYDVHSLSKDIKSETPFKDFIKDELRIATYKYKRQQVVEDEEGNKTIEEMPNEEVDSQIGFIAQDIRNTDVGSLFVYGEDGNMNYSPAGFTSVVAKALQEEINHRDKQIESLEEKIKLLEKKINALVS